MERKKFWRQFREGKRWGNNDPQEAIVALTEMVWEIWDMVLESGLDDAEAMRRIAAVYQNRGLDPGPRGWENEKQKTAASPEEGETAER